MLKLFLCLPQALPSFLDSLCLVNSFSPDSLGDIEYMDQILLIISTPSLELVEKPTDNQITYLKCWLIVQLKMRSDSYFFNLSFARLKLG